MWVMLGFPERAPEQSDTWASPMRKEVRVERLRIRPMLSVKTLLAL